METATFVSHVKNLSLVDADADGLYFGNEFCQRLIPSAKELERALEAAEGKGFTFVTPYATDEGLERLQPALEFLAEAREDSEVVVNDWGVLALVRREFPAFVPVLGRLLTKQKRGPRIMMVTQNVPESMVDHFRQSNIDVPVIQDFLRSQGIARVELDNLLQGVVRHSSLAASLYYPYAYISTTRLCLTSCCDRRTTSLREITSCGKECHKFTFKLSHAGMPVTVLLKGNAQFFRNDKLPDNLAELGVDRLVYEPEIPM